MAYLIALCVVSVLTATCAAPAYSLRFPVALPLVLLGLLDVVAVAVLLLWACWYNIPLVAVYMWFSLLLACMAYNMRI